MPLLTIFRWTLLALGIFGVLASTVFFHAIYENSIELLLRASERRLGQPVKLAGFFGAMTKRRGLLRAWNLVYSLLFIVAWWYLGTPAGAALWHRLAAPPSLPR